MWLMWLLIGCRWRTVEQWQLHRFEDSLQYKETVMPWYAMWLFVGNRHFYRLILIENEAGRSQLWQNKGSSTARLLRCPSRWSSGFCSRERLGNYGPPGGENSHAIRLVVWLVESARNIFFTLAWLFLTFFWAISECFGFVKNAQLAKYSETHRPSTSGRSTVSFFQLVADVLSRRQDVKSNQPSLKQLSQSLLGNLIKFIGQWKFP